MRTGQLFCVVGASGAGKDTLLGYARARLAGVAPVFFAHRYITRPAAAGGENHVELSTAEFERRLGLGAFALHWDSHGFRYGIGREIDLWMQAGASVVMNGSRAHLPEAARRYPDLRVVLVEVSAPILRARLEARGREGPAAIEERVARAAEFTVCHGNVVRVRNDGPVEEAGEALAAILASWSPDEERAPALAGTEPLP